MHPPSGEESLGVEEGALCVHLTPGVLNSLVLSGDTLAGETLDLSSDPSPLESWFLWQLVLEGVSFVF